MVGAIGKWLFGTITSAVAIIGIIWIGVQYGSKQYDLGYDQGHGDISVLNQLISHKNDEIATLDGTIKTMEDRLDSSWRENTRLKALLRSKVVVRDTIIYENDGIALFDGYVTISCSHVFTESTYPGPGPQAVLDGWILEKEKPGQPIELKGFVGEQAKFQFKGKNYLVVILGCKEYNGQPGVKIAIYRD